MWTSARHLTAIQRTNLSRPIQLALADGIVSSATTLFDYGSGRGGDLARLKAQGIECAGWDPIHCPTEACRAADVVNLGYVINVIEDMTERMETLRCAWQLARCVLIVSARLEAEARKGEALAHQDGYMTRLGTFQKLYQQHELREWIDTTLDVSSVSAGPGIVYVFRDEAQRQGYLASRFRRVGCVPRIRSDELFDRHRDILQPLLVFLCERGRLPLKTEIQSAEAIVVALGSLQRAFSVLRDIIEDAAWEDARARRTQDLLIYLALARFGHRPRLSELPADLQADIRAFFTSYQAACELADAMLFAVGDTLLVDQLCRKSKVGKRTPSALYVHATALSELDPVLRLYEGCARMFIGSVEGANIIKLHRGAPQISYLAYPDFERDPHPALHSSLLVPLQSFRVDTRYYDASSNPPILHRKEEFVAADHPLRAKFARLTAQEERYGLYAHPQRIGTRDGWSAALAERQLALRGHRVIRL